MAKYNMTFEEAQEYISKRGFDIAWNDCDVFVDVRHITQAIGNVLKWADNNPQWKPSEEQLDSLRIAIGDEQGSDCCGMLRSLLKDLKSL